MFDWLPPDFGCSRCILAALVSAKDRDADARLDELAIALASRRAEFVGKVVQRRGVSRARRGPGVKKMNAPLTAATVFGSGKVREFADLVATTSATILIVATPLKVSQRQRLADAVGCAVVAPSA